MAECEKLDHILQYMLENKQSYWNIENICNKLNIYYTDDFTLRLEKDEYIKKITSTKDEAFFHITREGEQFIKYEGGYCFQEQQSSSEAANQLQNDEKQNNRIELTTNPMIIAARITAGAAIFAAIIGAVALFANSFLQNSLETKDMNRVNKSNSEQHINNTVDTKEPSLVDKQNDFASKTSTPTLEDKPSIDSIESGELIITIMDDQKQNTIEGVKIISDDFEAITNKYGKFKIPREFLNQKGNNNYDQLEVTLKKEGYMSQPANIGLSEPSIYTYKLKKTE